ncbi:hypothetical protein [Methylobacterium radiodurans]|uniref:hypothetical protein n=1 Tax=Methylobacterium radiodurans TaxID=2202828 RepID=UPI001FEA9BAD|nr:hypothetical protein [Methylobacterium radiodurans]
MRASSQILPSRRTEAVSEPRLVAVLREALAPANLALGAVLLLGWFALVSWTGAGPAGWQARLCAGLDLQPRACGAVQVTDEAAVLRSAEPGRAS